MTAQNAKTASLVLPPWTVKFWVCRSQQNVVSALVPKPGFSSITDLGGQPSYSLVVIY